MQNAESLAKLKKDALAELCRQYGVSGYSRMKKDDMIAAILAAQGGAPAEAAEKKSEKPKSPARNIAAAKAEAPKAKAPKAAEKAPVKSSGAGDGLAAYCAALINLWGVAPIAQIVSAYARHHGGKSVSADDIKALESGVFAVEGEDLVHKSLSGNEAELTALRSKKTKYPFYVPEADEVEKYLDPAFRENSHAFAAMSGFLTRTFGLAESGAKDATGKMLGFLNSENGAEPLIALLKAQGVKFSDSAQFRNFGVLLDNLRSSARLWELNGHTAAEARNFEDHRGPVRVIKVGRNDPCPCGSGKKYKKCCGR